MQDHIEWARRRLQDAPCTPFDADLYATGLLAFEPTWLNSNPPDPGDVRAFLAAHRRQVADDPSLSPVSPHDFGRLTQAHETQLPAWDIEQAEHRERVAAEARETRELMLAEAEDERMHPTVP
jgi:hypothetical protein